MKRKGFFTTKQLACYLMITCFFICFCTPLGALAEEASAAKADEKHVSKMEEMVVTATRIEEPKKDVSSSVQIITAEDIKNSTAQDAGDLIAESGVGHTINYKGFLNAMTEVRGLTTDVMGDPLLSRVLVLVNGSNAGTVNLSKIPVDDIERIEIVKGPASVLYGSGAMGGVINVITKKGRGGFHGSVGGEGGSFGYWKAGAEAGGKQDRLDYYVTANRSGQGDYRVPDLGKIDNSAWKAEDVSTRLGYTLFNDHRVSVGFQHMKAWDVGFQGATYDPDPDNYGKKSRDNVDVNYEAPSFKAKYYHVWDTDENHTNPGGMVSGPGNSEIATIDRYSQGANLQKTFSIGDHRVIVGGQWDRITTKEQINDRAPYYPDSQYDSYGAYSEGRLSLFDKRLLLSAGVRYDYFQNELSTTPGLTVVPRTDHLDHVTPRGGAVFKLTDALSLKGNLGSAFRAPSPLELASDYVLDYGGGFLVHTIGNPNLKPETSVTWDVGVDYAKGPFKGDFTFFHTDFRDKIVSNTDYVLMETTYKNADSATIEGLELNAAYDIGHALRLGVILEPYVHATYRIKYLQEVSGVESRMPDIAAWTAAGGIRAGQKNWDARVNVSYHGPEDTTDWNPSSPTFGQLITKGGFTVVSLKGSYRPIKHLELTASIENLFDQRYEYALGYPMPGITFVGGAKILF